MSDETFSRRWLLLSVIGMLTSFLLTIGIAAFGFRGVASADQRPARQPTTERPRSSNPTFLVHEIGGGASRTPTATAGTAPTLRGTEEPLLAAFRFVQGPGTNPAPLPTATPEATEVPLPPIGSTRNEPAVRDPQSAAPTSRPVNPAPVTSSAPARSVETTGLPPVPTSTPVPRANSTAVPSPTIEPPKPTATATSQAARAVPAANRAPTVSIQLSSARIAPGESVTVTVYGTDDSGLDWIAWEGLDTGERSLDRESRENCGDKTTCVQSWTARVSRAGLHKIQARARDGEGLKSEPAIAELRVREISPTATVRVPTPTSTPTSVTRQAAPAKTTR